MSSKRHSGSNFPPIPAAVVQRAREREVIEFMGGVFKWNRNWGKLGHSERLRMVKAALPDLPPAACGELTEGLTSLWGGGRAEMAMNEGDARAKARRAEQA